jgi:hypothetical protein
MGGSRVVCCVSLPDRFAAPQAMAASAHVG